MLSWATDSLFADGRSQSDIRQGVTLEVFGEGWSLGPLNDRMKKERLEQQSDITYDITWTTLAEALRTLATRGISTNIASFVGATTVRMHEIADDDRPPTADELKRMRALVAGAMRDGALGVGSSLIYAPAAYASTDELVALCEEASPYGGMYISHMRSEGDALIEAIDASGWTTSCSSSPGTADPQPLAFQADRHPPQESRSRFVGGFTVSGGRGARVRNGRRRAPPARPGPGRPDCGTGRP